MFFKYPRNLKASLTHKELPDVPDGGFEDEQMVFGFLACLQMTSYHNGDRHGSIHRSHFPVALDLETRIIIRWLVNLGKLQPNRTYILAL